MSKARTMGAGNAGASRYVALNGNNGGGSKKQGLPSSVGRKENYDRSYGTNRDVVFYMNQLGGIGKGRSMFSTNSDGVHNPIKPSETEPLFKNSVSANIVINIEGDFYDYFKTASNSEQINIMTDTLSNYHNVSNEQIIINNIEIGSIIVDYDVIFELESQIVYFKQDVENFSINSDVVTSLITAANTYSSNTFVESDISNASVTTTITATTAPETEALTSTAPTTTEDTVMDGVLLLTVGSKSAYGANGGSRLILVQMDDTISLPTSIVDAGYSINNNSDITNALQVSYTAMDTDHTYRQSYAASDTSSVKYVSLDCSEEVIIKNTVNLSLTRPGVVTTHYLVPMNYNTSVTGSDNTSAYEGTSYGDTTFKNLADALQDSDGLVSDNLIAEYGMGYNDAQGIGLGNSIEIDLFEMTPCSMATTLHGAIFGSDNTISSTDTDGAFCNVHGASGYTDYSSGSIEPQTTTQTPDNKYIQYTYTKEGVSADVTDVNKYGPGTEFGINTLQNIDITNTIRGYAYSGMGQILVDASIIESEDDYSEDDGWMQMTTTLTQGTTEISISVLSQGFPSGSGVENIHYVMSLWMKNNNYWLDGQIPDSNGDGTGVVRGWVDYYDQSTISADNRELIIDSDTYDSLDDVYKSTEGYSSIAEDGADLSNINPSISLFGNMSITDINTDNVTYAVSLDIMFRSLDDSSGYSSRNWSAQYAMSYGVHYSSELTIDEFDDDEAETSSALNILVRVAPVTDDVTSTVATNYHTAMQYEPWSTSYGYPYSPDPGSYLTNTSDDLPDAVSGTGGFRIPSNQPVYMVFSGLLESYTDPVGDFLSSVMPTDGVNYIVLK